MVVGTALLFKGLLSFLVFTFKLLDSDWLSVSLVLCSIPLPAVSVLCLPKIYIFLCFPYLLFLLLYLRRKEKQTHQHSSVILN